MNFDLIRTKYTHGYKNFINDDEHEFLLDFIKLHENKFMFSGDKKMKIKTIQNIEGYPEDLILNLRKRIIDLEKIGKHWPDINHEDAVSWIDDNGEHNYHKDVNLGPWTILRYNVLLSCPEKGGLSVYGDEINYWEEKSVWRCVSGLVGHGVTKVFGNKPRISLSLGFLLRREELTKNTEIVNIPFLSQLPIL